jgi:hypothetical protein
MIHMKPLTELISSLGSAGAKILVFLRTCYRLALLLAVLPVASALASQLTLTWQDNSDDELGFKIERNDNGAGFVQITTVGPDVTTYVDTTIVPGTVYSYRVAAFNAVGGSPYTNVVTNAPAIATQPASPSVTAFQTAVLTVVATGVPAPSFQWKKGGVDLVDGTGTSGVVVSGATTATLTLTGVRVADAATYTVAVSNGVGSSVLSTGGVLTVNKAPQTITLNFNGSATYSPGGIYNPAGTSTSGLPISYSSSNSGVASGGVGTVTISGAGSTSITASQAGDVNYLAATSGNSQTFTVDKALQTITFPAIPLAAVGSSPITLNATASSGLPVTYTSENTGVATVSGNVLTVLAGPNFANIDANQGGDTNYFPANQVVQVANVQPAGFPIFTTQPAAQTIAPAGTAVFTVTVTGTPAPTLQWQVSTNGGSSWTNLTNTSPYSGVTTSTLTITGAGAGLNTNQYRCVATNTVGVGISNAAILTVGIPTAPTFSLQPSSQAATVGATALFSATASGIPTPTLQWQVSTDGGANWTNLTNITPYSGVTTGTLTVSSVALGQTGYQYRSVATNTQGSANSNAATLTVNGIAPTISGQPSDQAATVGNTVTFSFATSGGNPVPTLKWQLSTDGGVNWTDLANTGIYSGVTTTTLTLTNVTLGLSGNKYRGVATNTAGTGTSSSAALTVSSAPTPPNPSSTTAPAITTQPVSQLAIAGGSAVFSVVATGNPAPSYQWRRNGANISGVTGSTLTVTGLSLSDSGAVFDVVASNSAGSATSTAAILTVTSAISTSAVFSGDLGTGGKYSLYVRGDGTAVLIASLPNGRGNFVVNFTIGADGTFHVTTSVVTAANVVSALDVDSPSRQINAVTSVSFTGAIANGQLTGQIDGSGDAFGGLAQALGGASSNAGYYQAAAVNGGSGTAYVIVSPSGTVTGLVSVNGILQAGVGTVGTDGKFTLQLSGSLAFTAALNGTNGSVSGQLLNQGTATGSFAGLVDNVAATDQLVNISARATSGDNEQIVISGFIIGGTQSRTVMVRAIGPSLAAYGVTGVMENPVLTIYDANRNAILTNDDWSSSPDAALLSSTATRVGAFTLAAGSKDAAVIATLPPGNYTAQATRAANTANGVALIEVYDANSTAGNSTQSLVNISSRGQVRTGDGVLIDGFIVSGNAPKKVLIRGVGPSLTAYGVVNVLGNPFLKLFQGSTVIASNDDWGSGDANAIVAASAQVGAFPLGTNSKDSVLLLTLVPGLYTVQLSGADGGTGVGLLEVYQVQ